MDFRMWLENKLKSCRKIASTEVSAGSEMKEARKRHARPLQKVQPEVGA